MLLNYSKTLNITKANSFKYFFSNLEIVQIKNIWQTSYPAYLCMAIAFDKLKLMAQIGIKF